MRALALCLVLGLGLGCRANDRNDAPARAVAQIAPRLSRSSAGLTEVVHPDGRRSLRVNGTFSQAQIARVTASGEIVTECVDSAPSAARALSAEGAR